jgi:hypothetical protein
LSRRERSSLLREEELLLASDPPVDRAQLFFMLLQLMVLP